VGRDVSFDTVFIFILLDFGTTGDLGEVGGDSDLLLDEVSVTAISSSVHHGGLTDHHHGLVHQSRHKLIAEVLG